MADKNAMDRGNEATSGKDHYTNPVFGTDNDGNDVTVATGREGTSKEGQTLISDGHKSDADFKGEPGSRGHDHYDGKGGGTDRGEYKGEGS